MAVELVVCSNALADGRRAAGGRARLSANSSRRTLGPPVEGRSLPYRVSGGRPKPPPREKCSQDALSVVRVHVRVGELERQAAAAAAVARVSGQAVELLQ